MFFLTESNGTLAEISLYYISVKHFCYVMKMTTSSDFPVI